MTIYRLDITLKHIHLAMVAQRARLELVVLVLYGVKNGLRLSLFVLLILDFLLDLANKQLKLHLALRSLRSIG